MNTAPALFLLKRVEADEAAVRHFAPVLGGRLAAHFSAVIVLAECAAKRAIIADLEDSFAEQQDSPTMFSEGKRYGLILAINHLAAAYSNHPDYDQDWLP